MMTYDEFVKHVLAGREIEFKHEGHHYFITEYDKITTLENCDTGDKVCFGNRYQLIDNKIQLSDHSRKRLLNEARFVGKSFSDVFDDVEIGYIY